MLDDDARWLRTASVLARRGGGLLSKVSVSELVCGVTSGTSTSEMNLDEIVMCGRCICHREKLDIRVSSIGC